MPKVNEDSIIKKASDLKPGDILSPTNFPKQTHLLRPQYRDMLVVKSIKTKMGGAGREITFVYTKDGQPQVLFPTQKVKVLIENDRLPIVRKLLRQEIRKSIKEITRNKKLKS